MTTDGPNRIEQLAELTEAFCNEEAFQAWARLRRGIHAFSFTNQMLIAAQAYERGMTPTMVQAAWRWKRAGYHPAKGSQALWVWTYRTRRRKNGTWTCCEATLRTGRCPKCGRVDHYFRPGPVFDASQVCSFADGKPPETALPSVPVAGDELGHLIGPVTERLIEQKVAATVTIRPVTESARGWYDHSNGEIVIDADQPPNAQLRVLIHEAAHAMGISSRGDSDLTYEEAEVLADAAALLTCADLGLDTSTSTIPYIAGWGQGDAGEILRHYGAQLDGLAKRLLALAQPTEQETAAA